ncbi:MAG: hypothetical protein K0R65_1716 [Crocinitomicaceae bacterium]|jgi:hypothetical protein|nr:hypothetical protein [Crocinitomicaceae bacterium]
MKKGYVLFILFVLSFFLPGKQLLAAPINYTFQAVGGAYTANATPTVVIGGGDDEAAIPYLDIGFTFYFGCAPYTGFSVSQNGWMSLDPDCTDFHTVNNLSTATSSNGFSAGRPIIAPFWDDLSVSWTAGSSVNYKLTGAVGSRILTVEWRNMVWYWSNTGSTLSFQAKLYEGTNVIEFIYRQEATAPGGASRGASIGLGGLATGDYYTLNGTGAAPAASKATNTTNLTTRPATGQIYRWTPNCGVLPVDLLSFSGKNRGCQNRVEWKTASESKNNFFTVEKSTDGTEFFDLVQINGAGNSDQLLKYSVVDPKPAEITYYRLSQTDFDGRQVYYETILVYAQKDDPPIHPNPASDFVFIESEEESSYVLFNSSGIVVRQGIMGKSGFDVSELSEGVYFLKINNGNVQKIAVEHE